MFLPDIPPPQAPPTTPFTPEKKLAAAILIQAIDDLQHHRKYTGKYRDDLNRQQHRNWNDAEAWFLGHVTDGPFTFIRICELFQLDPQAVRQALLLNTQTMNTIKRRARYERGR